MPTHLTPAERREQIARYGRSYADLIALLDTIPQTAWHFRPSPTDWSIHQVIIHLGDSEANSMMRFRRPVAEPGEGVYGYDQDKWADTLDYSARSTTIALAVLKAVRDSNYEFLQAQPDSVFANTVVHSERGA